jgi:uncharacterized lipoprotein
MVTHKQIILGLLILLSVAACGKKAETATKTAEQAKSEQAASAAKARESVVYGDQLKAMDKAKSSAEDAAKATEEKLKQATQ